MVFSEFSLAQEGFFSAIYLSGSKAIAGNLNTDVGLWYSVDAGQNWTQSNITSGFFNSVYTTFIGSAIACSNDNGGLWYSSDGGVTWQQSNVNTGNFISCYMHGINDCIASASADNGLWYSSDGGANWQQSNIVTGTFNVVYISVNSENALAGGFLDNGIYHSSDSGKNWTQSLVNGSFTSFCIRDNNAVACSTSSGLWYSIDYGATWTQSNINTGYYSSVSISGTNIIAGGVDGIYYSSNSGETWSKIFTSGFIIGVSLNDYSAIACGNDGIYCSSDSGQTWGTTNVSIFVVKVFIDGSNTYAIACTNDTTLGSPPNGIYFSSSAPTPTPTPTPTPPPPCFLHNSKILTNQGYRPIQDLRKGDLVKTLKHYYKPIEMIGKRDMNHPASQERIKNQLYKCSKDKYPELNEDLIITGCHSILVDSFKSEEQIKKAIEVNEDRLCVTDDKFRLPACVDDRASVYETPGEYTVYHLALENEDYFSNYGIYANGLLVETCSKRYLKELSGMELIE